MGPFFSPEKATEVVEFWHLDHCKHCQCLQWSRCRNSTTCVSFSGRKNELLGGQGRPEAAIGGQRRPEAARGGQRRPEAARGGQRRPEAAQGSMVAQRGSQVLG